MNIFLVLFPDCKKGAASLAALLLLHFKCYALLVCPPNQVVSTQGFACEVQLDYASLVWSNSNPLTDTTFLPAPGYDFPIGNTQVTLSVTELGGNMLSCNFNVTVQMPFGNQMACGDNIPIDLGPDCTKVLTAADMLAGTYGCSSVYEVVIIHPSGGIMPGIATVAHIGEPQTVKVTNTLNGNSCWGTFLVNTGSLPFSITCPSDTMVGCNHSLEPASVGVPSFASCLDSNMVSLTHLDNVTLPDCNSDNTVELLRTWKAEDYYHNVRQCQQHIIARRGTLDEIIFPSDLNFSCEQVQADSSLTTIDMAGEPLLFGEKIGASQCDMSVEYTDSLAAGCGAGYDIFRKWSVVEWCEVEVRSHTQSIHVEDATAPVVALPDTVFISTNPICGLDATFPAAWIDDCSGTDVMITTPWSTANTNGGNVAVNPLAGFHSATYTVTDDCSNVTLENVVLAVQNGIIANCPPDTTVDCHFYETTLAPALASGDSSIFELMGLPAFYANCHLTPRQNLSIYVDSCGSGQIVRTMGNEETSDQCVQHIEVAHLSDFVVQFPADLTFNCSMGTIAGGEPTIIGADCEHIQVSFSDNLVQVQGTDACYKIIRTWVVKNTCIADTTNSIVETDEFHLPAGSCDLDGDGDCDKRTFKDGGDGYISYEQVIKIQDQIAPVFVDGCVIPDVYTDTSNCAGTVVLPMPAIEECGEYSVSAQFKIGGVWLSGFGPYMNVPVGTYDVRYSAYDFCNNQTNCTTTVKVVDNVPPIAICKDNLTMIIDASQQVDIWAPDFDNGSHDNCPGILKFSFSQNVNDIHRIVSCNDIGLLQIPVWVTDKNGNQKTCISNINVQGNGASCEPNDILGQIRTETNIPAANFLVTSSIGDFITTSNGVYYLGGYYSLPNTEIIPTHDEYPANGVTTFDVVTIRKHILGNGQLGSPYKIIAADANHSNSVTTYDLVVITKVILGNAPNFQNNTSWRFVPANYQFSNPDNPFLDDFPETIQVSPGIPSCCLFDFIAIKVGDVNNSAAPNFTGSTSEGK